MRDQLIQYVNLLFAGVPDCEDMKQEILQNTLDRYDDLIAQGKVPEAAYRLAITGIGDINEILGTSLPDSLPVQDKVPEEDTDRKKRMRAIAIALYILCPAPILILGNLGSDWLAIIGVCGLLGMVAAATVLMVLGSVKEEEPAAKAPETELQKSISSLIWALGLAVYFGLSFHTQAWHLTWLIFPMIGAAQGLVKAILDLKEATTQ